MDLCNLCGAELGIGRFCTNCGHPVSDRAASESWRTDTAERPRVTVPPPAPSFPEPPRFPLYADQPAAPVEEPTEFLPPVRTGPWVDPPRHRGDDRRRGVAWVGWTLGFLVMALVAAAGAWLLLGSDDEPSAAQQEPPRSSRDGTPGRDRSPEPNPEPSTREESPSDVGEPVELASTARVDAPPAAPPSQDSSGNTVRYVATHMVDGLDETTWRMPGDGTGESITFRLDSPAVLTEVGLVNGYAKVGRDADGLLDWYAGNRRVLEVEWSFDDGTVVTQSLRETAQMQTVELDDVETASATLRLVEVSPPGTGRASRDFTAISDVQLTGLTTS